MKFIRDIISEKSRLSAERAASLPPAGLQPTHPLNAQQSAGAAPDWDSIETRSPLPDAIQEPSESSLQAEDEIALDATGVDPVETPDTSDTQPETDAFSEDDLMAAPEDMSGPDLEDPDLDEGDKGAEGHDGVLPVLKLDAFDLSETPAEEGNSEPETAGSQMLHDADDGENDPDQNALEVDMPDAASTPEMNIFMPSDEEYEEEYEDFQAAPQENLQAEPEAETEAEPVEERAEDKIRRVRDAFAPAADAEATAPSPETQPAASGFGIPKMERPPIPVPSTPSADQAAAQQALAASVSVPAPAVGRGAARAGRVKTRLLGFNSGPSTASDPFDKGTQQKSGEYTQFPVGWLVVVDGHGRGSAFTLFDGVSLIGRATDQTVCLDFGDNSISRASHAVIAYDAETRKFYLGHGGKTNLVRLNNRPVLSTEEMGSGDLVRIGETTLRFVGLCGNDFQWHDDSREVRQNASFS